MSAEQHRRLADLFKQACDLPPDQQSKFIEAACGDDLALQQQLRELLAHDDQRADFLDVSSSERDAERPLEALAPLPERVGKYRVVRLLGQGGMGVVYLAEQDSPHRTVALKLLAPGVSSESLVARFTLEADALARLHHPGIAHIFETGLAEVYGRSQPYYAMEYVEGTNLLEHARHHRLDDRARLNLLIQLCDAIQHAHQRGIIHRDLKPANLLVTDSGQLKVLDFGVARFTDSDITAATLRTQIGQLIGTIPYMSPEQAAGNSQAIDTRSDVYAVGVIAYELLSGQLPYDVGRQMIHEAVRVVQDQAPLPLSHVTPRLRGDVETILGKALEKEPARRYQSASEFAEDLRRFLNVQPILARPPSAIYQLKKFARRNSLLVGSVCTVAAMLVIGTAATSLLAYQLAQQRNRATELQRQAESDRDAAEAARVLAEREVQLEKAMSGFVQDVFAAGSPYAGKQDTTISEALDLAASHVNQKFQDLPELATAVRMRIADNYYSLGQFHKSLDQLLAALRSAEEQNPPNYQDLALAHAQLGQVYNEMGNRQEARTHLEKSVELFREHAAADDPARLTAMVNYAALLMAEDEFSAAIPLMRETLELREKTHGAEHPYSLTALNNLAMAMRKSANLEEAERLSRRSVEIHRRAVGDKHPNTITGIYNLADLLRELGRLEESEAMFKLCIDLGQQHLPTHHFLVGLYQNGYGEMLRVAQRREESETALLGSYEILQEQLGPDHPNTQRAVHRLVNLYEDWNRPEQITKWQAKLAAK